jgi:hypothetical protein
MGLLNRSTYETAQARVPVLLKPKPLTNLQENPEPNPASNEIENGTAIVPQKSENISIVGSDLPSHCRVSSYKLVQREK